MSQLPSPQHQIRTGKLLAGIEPGLANYYRRWAKSARHTKPRNPIRILCETLMKIVTEMKYYYQQVRTLIGGYLQRDPKTSLAPFHDGQQFKITEWKESHYSALLCSQPRVHREKQSTLLPLILATRALISSRQPQSPQPSSAPSPSLRLFRTRVLVYC